MSVTRNTRCTFFIDGKFPAELIRFFPLLPLLLKLALRLVSAEEIVQSPVEEISNHIVEFLSAVKFESGTISPETSGSPENTTAPCLSNVLAKMLFYQDHAEDDFTRRNSLLTANSPPFLILVAYRIIFWITDSISKIP